MIKTILVEDERLARNELRSMLKNFESISIIEEAENVSDAFEKIERLKPDLIFLDIQMPGEKNGFDLLEMLHHMPLVVFTTAHHEYALMAFEVNALDYLLKPIETQRLEDAIKKTSEAKWKPVNKICKQTLEILQVYPSLKSAAFDNGITNKSISNVITGRAKSAGGFGWSLAE